MVTLTGTFTRLDGTPASGTVRVTPSRSPIMDPQGRVVISGPQTFPLDADGKLAVQIPASNDPDLGPPFTYTVEALLSHNPWKISKVWIPHGSSTVDLSEIGDYTPVPGEPTRTVTIPADGTDGQVLVWDGVGFSWEDSPPGLRGPEGPRGLQGPRGLTGPQGPAIDINTGLPIQIDTTVGTRIFIGGHMVYGDTGWRTLTSWDSAGTVTGEPLPAGIITDGAGSIRIRRENNTTKLRFYGLTIVSNPSMLLPTGFNAVAPYARVMVVNSATEVGVASPGAFSITFTAKDISAHGTFGLSVEFEASGAWPPTLPGTP